MYGIAVLRDHSTLIAGVGAGEQRGPGAPHVPHHGHAALAAQVHHHEVQRAKVTTLVIVPLPPTRCVTPILAAPRRLSSPATATGPELGPGCYSPHVRMQGGFNEMSRRDDWARTQPVFVSTTDRFAKSAWTAR